MRPVLPPKPETLRSYVANYIRQAILDGRFLPGDRLIERELCEMLNVSRPPVREALRDLEADKLISKQPYRGPIVASISYQDAHDLYAYRCVLESFAAAQFARLGTDKEIRQLGLATERLFETTKDSDISEILAVVAEFYDIIFTGCRNSLIKESLVKLMDRIILLRRTSMSQPNRLFKSYEELELMYKTIKSRDPSAAADAARNHVLEASKVALEFIKK